MLLFFSAACGGETRPPELSIPAAGGNGGGSYNPGGIECEPFPSADTTGSCGQETVNLQQQKPTLYFVLDTSGSMSSSVADDSTPKINAARTALTGVVSEIGHQILYGLTTFPGPKQKDDPTEYPIGCEPGEEVFPITEGDEKECLNLPARGPHYRAFYDVVDNLSAEGGTPLSPTLAMIAPTLVRNEGQLAVILVTDGAPNCNPQATCDIDNCQALGVLKDGTICGDGSVNCCSDEYADRIFLPASNCQDGPSSVEQVQQLHDAGIDTYVVGVLGDEDFDDVMNDLAVAGGQARDGSRKYYDVASLDELTDVVRRIGSAVAQSCTLDLKERPAYANTLNVYFDGEVVPFDENDGWTFSSSDTVELHGDACDTWKSGSVDKIEFVSGCETIIR